MKPRDIVLSFFVFVFVAHGCGGDDTAADAGRDATIVTPPPPDSALPDSATPDSAIPDADTPDATDAPDATATVGGTFRFLTYNVAGLPDVISGSDPAVNTSMISPLLNAYDIVVAQEDFSYHTELLSAATHAYTSGPSTAPAGRTFGDGLGRLSVYPFTDVEREQWEECNGIIGSGTDCLAGKGFSMAVHTLAPGVELHVYDLHMDAGRGSADRAAREAQSAQLRAFLATRSATALVIVAGDTNIRTEDEPLLLELLSDAALADACRALACPDPSRVDRVMFRNGGGVELTPTLWQLDPRFVDAAGDDLSDHSAVGVDFEWRRAP